MKVIQRHCKSQNSGLLKQFGGVNFYTAYQIGNDGRLFMTEFSMLDHQAGPNCTRRTIHPKTQNQ